MTSKIKAILFDMDGVIADTQVAHSHVESLALAQKGIKTTPEALEKEFSGNTERVLFETMLLRHEQEASQKVIEELVEFKKNSLAEYLKIHPVQFIPGVFDLIKGFHQMGLPMAVASSSPKAFIEFVINELELYRYFLALTSGHEVPKSKPDPAIFLLAAQKIQAEPKHCLVIEDAIHGMNAAKSAGMYCLGLWKKEQKTPADYVVNTFVGKSPDFILSVF